MFNPASRLRVVRDPKRCGGERTIRGTRVTVRVILASLAEGDRPEEIVQAFPSLSLEDVQAAIEYGTDCLDENVSETAVLLHVS